MVLVECAYVPFGVLVRSVVRGLFDGTRWDPRNLLPFGIGSIHGSLIEEKAKGITKALERCKSSRSVGSRK